MKSVELQITQTRHHLSILDGTPNIHEWCTKYNHTTFEYKEMKTFGAIDYTN